MDKIDKLIRDLHNGKPDKRIKIAGSLAKINDPRAIYALLDVYKILADTDGIINNPDGKIEVMDSPRGAIIVSRLPEVAKKIAGKKYLIQALHDSRYRDAAESVLLDMGKGVIDTLLEELENPVNKELAYYILARLHNRQEKVVDQLLFAIGKQGKNDFMLPFLFRLIHDDILIYAEYKSLISALGHLTAGKKVTEYLAKYGTTLIHSLIGLLNPTLSYWSGNVSNMAYQNVIKCIKLMGVFALEPLIHWIDKGDVNVPVTKILTDIGQPAVPYLINVLNDDPNKQARGMAARTLGDIRDNTCTANLITSLRRDEDSDVRTQVIKSLGKIGDTSAVNFLIQSLDDDEVRSIVASTLGQTPAFYKSLQKFNDDLSDLICTKCFCHFEKGKIFDGNGRNLYCPVCRKCQKFTHFYENVHIITLVLDNRFPSCVYKEWLSYDHIFRLHNGPTVSGLYELCIGLRTINEKDYRNHVTRKENEIATWVRDILGNPSLSDRLANCLNPISAAAQIEQFLGLWRYETDTKNLFIHWFWHKESIDFNQVIILNANEYEIEEFIIRVRNDGDKFRQKRYKDIQVQVSANCKIPKAKLNLINSTFKKVVLMDGSEV